MLCEWASLRTHLCLVSCFAVHAATATKPHSWSPVTVWERRHCGPQWPEAHADEHELAAVRWLHWQQLGRSQRWLPATYRPDTSDGAQQFLSLIHI